MRLPELSQTNQGMLPSSASAIGLDEMVLDQKTACDLQQNILHIECSSSKPIEEVYKGVHDGPVLGSGISGLVHLMSHKATGIKYAC